SSKVAFSRWTWSISDPDLIVGNAPSNCFRPILPLKAGFRFWGMLSPIQPVGEPAGQIDPDLVLFGGILDPVLKIRVVVDFDHDHPIVRFLQIDAIKPVANAACRA